MALAEAGIQLYAGVAGSADAAAKAPQAVWNMILMRAATITITTTGKAMTVTAMAVESIHAIKHKLQRK